MLHSPGGDALGVVTSGSLAPSFDRPIAMGYVPPEYTAHCTRIDAMVRGKPVPMEVVPPSFYRHPLPQKLGEIHTFFMRWPAANRYSVNHGARSGLQRVRTD